jgi:type II secretory pathway component PulF
MALYRYEAFDQKGKKVSGTHEALSPQAVREQLARQSFYPTAIYRADEVQTTSWWRRLFKQRVTPQDRVFFTKQLSVLLRSGIPLLQALELLIEQTEGALSPLVVSLKDAVSQGASLADSLQKYSQVFDATYVQLVRAGEASGKLELILQRLTEYQEKRAELSKKITAALRYHHGDSRGPFGICGAANYFNFFLHGCAASLGNQNFNGLVRLFSTFLLVVGATRYSVHCGRSAMGENAIRAATY